MRGTPAARVSLGFEMSTGLAAGFTSSSPIAAGLRVYFDHRAPVVHEVAPRDAQKIGARGAAVRLEAREGAGRVPENGMIKSDLFRFAARCLQALHQG